MQAVAVAGMTLEPQLASHAPAMFELLCDPALYEYENEPPASLEALEARFRRLESRRSPDGGQHWLNWVVRLDSGDVAGFVQATVHGDGGAAVAYVFASRFWGRGIASTAVRAMMAELRDRHAVTRYVAVLKAANKRSYRLLERLGFEVVTGAEGTAELDAGEILMRRS
jgi:[ribosomal protein S5]-alanine N-acetyltransferase